MRKIPSEYENPLDDILIRLSDRLCPVLKKMNFTPNGITTLSLMSGIFSVVFLLRGCITLFVIFYFLSYFFDCTDGHYARKYDMTTDFGDFYDHSKDLTIAVAILVVVYHRNRTKKGVYAVIAIFIVFTLAGYAHLGCQEKYYGQDESGTLNLGKVLCPGNAEENMRYTRWFGMGTWVIITVMCVVYLEKIA